LEADFHRFYQLDLCDLWRGGLTPRKAAVLARNLPAGAQVWQSVGHDSAWTLQEHLTASVFDALQVGNWQRAGDAKASKPKPVQRPSDVLQASARADRLAARASAFMERQKASTTQPPEEDA